MVIDIAAIIGLIVTIAVFTVMRMLGFSMNFDPALDWVIDSLDLPRRGAPKKDEQEEKADEAVDAEEPPKD